jgi:hypothetical protein
MRVLLLGTAVLAGAAAGCGGSGHHDTSTTAGGQLPPGKVPRASKSNAHKEIPTRFQRAISLPFKSTILLVTAVRVARLGHDRGRNGDRVGIVVGLRNIGNVPWTGPPAALSKLAISREDAPQRAIGGEAASPGPCPSVVAPTRARATRSSVEVPSGRTAFFCVRFSLPRGTKAILYKFATQASDYTAIPPPPGHGYGVWALPGTLVESCRFAPGTVKGRCQGLEADERDEHEPNG